MILLHAHELHFEHISIGSTCLRFLLVCKMYCSMYSFSRSSFLFPSPTWNFNHTIQVKCSAYFFNYPALRLMAWQPYSGYVVTMFRMTWILAVTMICDCVAMSRHLNVKSCAFQLLQYSSLLLMPCVLHWLCAFDVCLLSFDYLHCLPCLF